MPEVDDEIELSDCARAVLAVLSEDGTSTTVELIDRAAETDDFLTDEIARALRELESHHLAASTFGGWRAVKHG